VDFIQPEEISVTLVAFMSVVLVVTLLSWQSPARSPANLLRRQTGSSGGEAHLSLRRRPDQPTETAAG
jgi:hypothetical protein